MTIFKDKQEEKYQQEQILSRHVDETALLAAKDEAVLEEFILQEKSYILSSAGKTLSRHIDKGSEEEVVALEAFVEAVQKYSFEKGNFLSFAKLVISRRMIDWIRKEKSQEKVILMDPADVTASKDMKDYQNAFSGQEAASSIREEIERLSETLKDYAIDFTDLEEVSPKALKTKESCKKAISFIISNELIYQEMRRNLKLPIKTIEKNTGVPRKILDRHRKYIIAVTEIHQGEYPCLAPYVRTMIKEM